MTTDALSPLEQTLAAALARALVNDVRTEERLDRGGDTAAEPEANAAGKGRTYDESTARRATQA